MASIYCAACGPAQANHTTLWLANSADTVALALPWSPARGLFGKIGNVAMSILGHIAYYLCRALGVITLSDDLSRAASNRTKLLWAEANRRGIAIHQMMFLGKPTDSFVGSFGGRMRFFKSIPLLPTNDAALRMDDKIWFKQSMTRAGFPVPRSYSARSVAQAREALAELKLVCVKPRTGSNGRHTYPYVSTEEDLVAALKSVRQVCVFASIEEQLVGNLCRATCVNGTLIGMLESGYPSVTGNGLSTIAALIAAKNAAREEKVEELVLTDSHKGYLKRRGYTEETVLPEGFELPLTYRAGYGQGGWNREHGRGIHPSFIPIIESAARHTGLSVVGFDIIIPDVTKPEGEQRWGFIEANSLPWIDLHNAPLYGAPIDLSPYVWDMWSESLQKKDFRL